MRFIALVLVCLLVCGCNAFSEYKNLCNALYCNPDLSGKTMEEVRDEYGDPMSIERKGDTEIWTYDVRPMWQYGSKGTIVVTYEGEFVSKSSFHPAEGTSQP